MALGKTLSVHRLWAYAVATRKPDGRHYQRAGGFFAQSRSPGAIQVFPTVWERCSVANGFGLQCRPQQIAWLWQTPEE